MGLRNVISRSKTLTDLLGSPLAISAELSIEASVGATSAGVKIRQSTNFGILTIYNGYWDLMLSENGVYTDFGKRLSINNLTLKPS